MEISQIFLNFSFLSTFILIFNMLDVNHAKLCKPNQLLFGSSKL